MRRVSLPQKRKYVDLTRMVGGNNFLDLINYTTSLIMGLGLAEFVTDQDLCKVGKEFAFDNKNNLSICHFFILDVKNSVLVMFFITFSFSYFLLLPRLAFLSACVSVGSTADSLREVTL